MNPIEKKLKTARRLDAALLQARIPRHLYQKLRVKLAANNITIQDFLEAAALTYLDK